MGFASLLRKIGILNDDSRGNDSKKSVKHSDVEENRLLPEKYVRTLKFNEEFDKLLKQVRFLARSDYRGFVEQYSDLAHSYSVLVGDNLLDDYIRKNRLDVAPIKSFIETFEDIKDLSIESSIIKSHNDSYISQQLSAEKRYLDNILKACDPVILLDNEQREVVLSDEDYTLVVAGAGAGKTTTVAAKVKYLVDRKGVDPKKILIISFTNKAVEELRERINENLNIPSPITTFHSAGYAIVNKSNVERKQIVTGGFLYNTIDEYLKTTVLKDEAITRQLILFFGSYFTAPFEGESLNDYFRYIAKIDFSTLKGKVDDYVAQVTDIRTKKAQTINNEVLRSHEEVQIANFLYMNNIEYEYEPVYKYNIIDSNKPYTPDFIIKQGDKISYIEHFGISESGENNRYNQKTLDLYKSRINDKIKLHRKHKTDLIYTFSIYNDGVSFIEHLREHLESRGYTLNERLVAEVYQKIVDNEESKYIFRLNNLICNFINNFKTQGYKYETFQEFKAETKNIRTKIFLDICSVCYLEYQKRLEEMHKIDFQDLINESAKLIRQEQITKEKLDFQYVIIDEYQDISRQRYNLIKELSKLCDAKIIAVGDDWQSIYAFSGSVLPLFTQFCKEFGYGQELYITRTYRNAQEIINIAGTFIQKNNSQIQKQLISPKRITNPVLIYTYSEDQSKREDGGRYAKLGEAVNKAIEEIIEYNVNEDKSRVVSILFIGRYGFDARNLCYSKSNFSYDEKSGTIYSSKHSKDIKLQFLTAHSSKGLSAENVIIINAKDETYGFPSKVDDDPVLNLVVTTDHSFTYAEERRLFYVALTRTKNRVFIVTPEKRPSEFIKELLRESENYPNVTLRGEIKTELTESVKMKNSCPICDYPLSFRWKKNYGLRLWICSNDQEVCGFMTNDLKGGELSICKCDHCKDGFLIVKQGGNNLFLGCTNYKTDGSGCSRTITRHQYNQWKSHDFGAEDSSQDKPSYLVKDDSEIVIPKIVTPKRVTPTKASKEERISPINTTEYQTQTIEKEGFNVIVDSNGCLLTDMELLLKLRAERMRIAIEKGLPAFIVAHNTVLVEMATLRPTTKDEYLQINKIGIKHYESYGREFMSIIEKHMNK